MPITLLDRGSHGGKTGVGRHRAGLRRRVGFPFPLAVSAPWGATVPVFGFFWGLAISFAGLAAVLLDDFFSVLCFFDMVVLLLFSVVVVSGTPS